MSLVELKVIFSVLVFITGAVGVLLPWALGGGAPAERFMAWGNAFAGGVVGGAGLIHLLSGGASGFRTLAPGLNYPLAFVLAGAGFLLLLLIETVIMVSHSHPAASLLKAGSGVAGHQTARRPSTTGRRSMAYVLLLVLSIHSLIVGLALGAQRTLSEALAVFIAIVAHKAAAAFALGISYRRAGFTLRKTAPAAVFFSSMTPLGILAGTAVEALVSSGGSRMFEAVFDSVGAGTFLYIASIDIVRREFELRGDRWQKWLFAASGFSMMAVLALWT